MARVTPSLFFYRLFPVVVLGCLYQFYRCFERILQISGKDSAVQFLNVEILLLLNIFGGVAVPADKRGVAEDASLLRGPVLALRDLHISRRNCLTAVAQLCVEEGCFEELMMGLEFSNFVQPSLLELVNSCRSKGQKRRLEKQGGIGDWVSIRV